MFKITIFSVLYNSDDYTEEEKKECNISEEFGEVIITQPNDNYPINSQCTLASYWATQFFPEDVCFICGIDEIALSSCFIKEMVFPALWFL